MGGGGEGAKPLKLMDFSLLKPIWRALLHGTDFLAFCHSKICLWVEFSCIWEKAGAFYRIYGKLELILG